MMILTSGNTYWNSISKGYKRYPTLNCNQECDVVVIGGGITGCLTAYYLSQYNINTILLEKNLIANGSTAASPCLLEYAINTELHNLINLLGKETAIRVYKLCQKSIDDIENILYNIRLHCDFQRKDSIYLCSDSNNENIMKTEFELRKEFNFNVEYMVKKEIENKFSFSFPCGIYSKNCGILDPFKFCHALLKGSSKKNTKIYENTSVVNFDYYSNNIRINTNNDCHIYCKKIVFANNFTAHNLLKDTSVVKLKTIYSMATEPLTTYNGWYEKCLIRESYDPNFYIRPTGDNRILACGFADDFKSSNYCAINIERKAFNILEKLKNLFPYIDNLKPDYCWCGTFGETKDSLPFIGKHPKFPHCYFNLGFNENGICYSVIGAQIIKDLILYNNNPDANIFSLDRKSLK
ncbi:NAD(P)/FAD-dependent oxidoreductase [Clostridium ganghwense]|uniref:FAD-dependent oxidoreductase n=1 Tax=Clostridium ganghwense TaxID=312089 RepID=A0ABT4CPZ2_9CLOT|nr:FAD-dependent oxidoreductase [Clostridium ganghwense]MCY6371115.1 FAD-dependent oxidoreductase [Clostridium ganghwense]